MSDSPPLPKPRDLKYDGSPERDIPAPMDFAEMPMMETKKVEEEDYVPPPKVPSQDVQPINSNTSQN